MMTANLRDVVELAVPGAIALLLGLRIRVPPYNLASIEYAYRSGLKGMAIAAGVGALLVALRLLLFPP
jgi:hypothetical protein